MNDYMTEEEEKEYGTMRRAKIAGRYVDIPEWKRADKDTVFKVPETPFENTPRRSDKCFTAKSSPIQRWEQLANKWIANKTMTESEVEELEKYIPNHCEVLKKYVENDIDIPSTTITPGEFVNWVRGYEVVEPNYNCGNNDWRSNMAYPKMESVTLADLGIGEVPVEPSAEPFTDWNFYGELMKEPNNKFIQRLEEAGLNPQEIADEWYPYDNDISCNVNSPKHYMLFPEQGIEVIDVRKRLMEGLEKKATAYQIDLWSRAWEYLTRCWEKNGEEDIKKAQWYLNRLVDTFKE